MSHIHSFVIYADDSHGSKAFIHVCKYFCVCLSA